MPTKGFDVKDPGFQAPAEDGASVEVVVSQLLTDYNYWNHSQLGMEKNISGAKLLIKAFGKCTTDHISMAGPLVAFPRTFG